MLSRRAGRFGIWVALLLLIPYLQFVGGAWFGLYLSPLRIATLVLLTGVIGAWLIAMWRDSSWRPRSTLLPVIGLALASLGISTVFSRSPRISAEYLAYAAVLAGLYLLLVRLLRTPFLARRIPNLAVVFAVVIGVSFLVAVVSRWTEWWGLVGHLTFPPLRPAAESFVYGNPSSVLAVVVLFVASALVVVGGSSLVRIAIALALLAMTAAVTLLSGSRAGWLSVGVTVVVLTIAVAIDANARFAAYGLIRRIRGSRRASLAVGGVGLAAIVAGIALLPGIIRRALEGGDDIRGGFVRAAIRMFDESPVVGTGPGTWVAQRIRYTEAGEVDYYIPHAHNVYAQTLSELGIVGAVVGIVVFAAVLRLIWTGMRSSDPDRRAWGWAALAAATYFAVHSSLDFFMNMPAVLFPLVLPIAVLDARALDAAQSSAERRTTGRDLAIAATTGAILVASMVALIRFELPAFANHRGVEQANLGNWVVAATYAVQAAGDDPDVPALHFTLGLALSRTGDHVGAEREFRLVAEHDDYPEAWLNLASELAALDRTADALEAIRRSLRLGDQRAAVSMPAGELALRLGDHALAIDAWAAAIATVPTLAADPWWGSDPDRAEAFQGALEAALDQVGGSFAWELALMAGDSGRARALVAATSPAELPDLVIRSWDGDAGGRADLYSGCSARPLDLAWLQWCGRIAGREGDRTEAADYRLAAGFILGGADETASFLRVATTNGTGRWAAGEPAEFWAWYTYRRPTPWDLLVQDLLHLVVE